MAVEYLRGESHVYRFIAGEHLLVALRGDSTDPMFALTPTAAVLWSQLAQWSSRASLVDRMVERFDVQREQADADVGDFLGQLGELDAVVTREVSE